MDIFANFIHHGFAMTQFVKVASIVLVGVLLWIKIMIISWSLATCVIMCEAAGELDIQYGRGVLVCKCPAFCLTVKLGVPSASLISSYIKGISTSD